MDFKTQQNEYRKVADQIWEMANKHYNQGEFDLAQALKEMASQLHELARKQEAQNGQS